MHPDILLVSTLPLHPYLIDHPRLSVRLIADDNICGETPSVDGDLATGIWEINSSLCANSVEHSVTLAIVAIKGGLRIQFASVKPSVAELLTQIEAQPDGYQEFKIDDSSSSVQLIISCSVKLSLSTIVNNLPVGTHDNHTIDSPTKNTQSDHELDRSESLSREELESAHANFIRMPDRDERKERWLSMLGRAYLALYQNEGGRADLETAISLHEEALQLTGPFHPRRAEHAEELSMVLITCFQRNGDIIDIEQAISYLQAALSFTEDRNADKPIRLNNLGVAFQLRFLHLGGLKDLEDAISSLQKAIQLTPNGHPDKPGQLSNLGNALESRFGRFGALTDLEDAISSLQKAVQLTPDGHPDKPGRLNNLAIALASQFGCFGGLTNLEDAISSLQKAVQLTPNGHPDKPGRLNNLGNALELRFDRLGGLTDLEDAISSLQKAIQLTPDGHPDKPGQLNNLGKVLNARFDRLDRHTDLEDAISSLQKAVRLTPDGHPDKPGRLNNLGNALESRFDRLGGLTDLEDAISSLQKAIQLTPDGHPDKPGQLKNLGKVLHSRFGRFGALTDLEDAISSLQKAVQLTPDGHPDKPGRLNDLGNTLSSRFGCLGGLADLEDAILNKQNAVKLTPDGHPDKPGRLNDLGTALGSRFDRLGGLADLEDAILNKQKAVKLTPYGHPNKPSLLSNLGNALRARFGHLGSLADLEGASSSLLQAVQLTPDGHPNKPSCLSNLGCILQVRFHRLGGLADLEDAISSLQQAVQLAPDGHPEKPSLLNNLGSTLKYHFGRLDCLVDLDNAISSHRQAVRLTPDGHPNKPSRLNNLGASLQVRFCRLGGLADLENAISSIQQAVQLTPDGHPEKPSRLHNLGAAFIKQFGCHGILRDLENGLTALSTAANSTSGAAMVRFKAARTWADVAEEHSRSPLDAFSCAINLLPRIAWLGLAVTDQHALLADMGGIVRDAVAAAIRYEEYETAVVWAEQGRSIVWQNLLGLRSPVDKLCETHPELASRLRRITVQLERLESREPLGDNVKATPVEDISHKYSKLALEWENLVDEIRSLPTFEGFLKAKTFRQLAPAAHEGPVVILNVNEARCDALVLTEDESIDRHVSAVNIPLEHFSHEKSRKMFESLTELLSLAGVRERNGRKTGRAQSRADSDAKFKVILRILWQDIVKPVIEGLAFQTESNRPPRIWWCATGILAFLPIHAAGLYDTPNVGEKVSDYVVSSYTPTLNAILELSDPVVREDFQVLTVAQASAPGAPPIPKTEDEVKIVRSLVASARVLNLTGENATVEQVREGMMESNWIHLACHGKQNSDNPMESGFLLHDRMLKLSEIVKMSLPKADFAFLSACQTAMGDEKIAEESVHLAAGMLLSGCRGVIATTWSIRDDDAPRIAQEFYSRIFKDGKPNRKEAAYALHEAVKLLRESGAPCTSWVPFIHIGR